MLNTLLAMSSSLVLAAANPSATGGSVENFAFGVTSGSQYALPDSGSETYTLVETAGSPPIIAIELPAETASAAQFSVSYLTGSTWSSATVEAPGSTVSLPNAEGVKVTLLDNTGAPIAAPGDLTFYLEFGSGGTFSGSITGNVPPPENTYTPTTLPSGGNPPISGQPNPVPCFRSGTHVLTQRGSVRVENLRIGDLVITYAQEYRPVVWVGYRDVNVSQHPRSQDVSPVRIHAHSFAVNQPSSDLWLSPDHAVFVENSLIPARYLVNGSSIVQEACEQISYWHVELDQHDIVLAEGLPCESYLDTGDRQGFANGCGAIEFHPSWRQGNHDMTLVMDALGYAPLRVTGSEVTRVRAQIAAREMSMRSEEHIGERSVA